MMQTDFAIETGIPVPKTGSGAPGKFPFREMTPGDSFLFPDAPKNFRSAISAAGKRLGYRFTARTVDGGVRVWRVA